MYLNEEILISTMTLLERFERHSDHLLSTAIQRIKG